MTRNRLPAIVRTLLPHATSRIAYLLLFWITGSCSPALADAPSTSDGGIRPAVLYHNYCSVCHGDKGDGRSRAQNSLNPPPRDFTTPSASQVTRASMIEAVRNGRTGTAMTPWKTQLNQKEIEAVVDYVRNTFMPASASSDSSRGRIVYSKNCSVCHGEKGDGRSRAQASLNPPPRDFTAPAARAELTQQRMITSVTFGRPDTAMAGFKTQLSKEDISAAVDYIRAGFMANANTDGISGIRNGRRQTAPDGSNAPMAAASTPATAPIVNKPVVVNMSAPMPKTLKGNLAKGGAFYMSNCATCHGSTGDGRGPRAYFINPKPRDFLHPASRQAFNRVALFDVISAGKLGTEMPAWRQVLSPQEIADVTEFVFQRFIHPSVANTKPAKAAK
ncbi:MAG: c-type cytochrome [Oxalobacteraceae bacterium]|nr:c-type cytochrome [Oxalobacteraceae bacterium]